MLSIFEWLFKKIRNWISINIKYINHELPPLFFLFKITQNYVTIFLKVIRRKKHKISQFFPLSIKSINPMPNYAHIIELSASIQNPVCSNICMFIKIYYICLILYCFRQSVSRINTIKSRPIFIILLYFKVC